MFTRIILIVFRLFNKLYSLGLIRTYLFFYDKYKYVSDFIDIKRLKRNITKGAVVIDAGANVGFYTRLFSQFVGESGLVIAFEPNLKNFEILSRRTKKLSNVVIVNAALSDKSGTLDLYISEDLNVDHQTYDSGESREKIKISCFSLDDYCEKNGIKDVSFVKMDLQGFDAIAFRGMEKTIQVSSNIKLCCEFWPYGMKKAGVEPEEMLSSIQKLGLVSDFQYSGNEEYGYYETLWLDRRL
ncbi:FkbM family methyltransferase [Leptospira sp. 201903075]|uniref:FkbM family methyltransferase n=1 Tax=Leptospira chreensis TaxID=2810035 RepID=UPI001966AE88|nr:FkbM family methyltransferase [Leptospira chreensis]MBM9589082.1 FkbM family methyltransferase [Leptospira chreensis]